MVGLSAAAERGSGDPERHMRFVLADTLIVVSLAGCGGHGGQTERIGPTKDTVVTERRTQDTTIVTTDTTDTTVRVDTTMRKGQEAVPTDSTKQPTDSGRSQ
jgi:hypothetical protein